jgi:hypothetical protein
MMDIIMQSLFTGGLIPGFELSRPTPATVKISIPRDHPKAEKLLALAEEVATRKTLDSGIMVDTGPNAKSMERILTMLRDIVDVDQLLLELNRQAMDNNWEPFNEAAIKALMSPETSSKFFKSAVDKGIHKAIGLTADKTQKLANVLDDAIEHGGTLPDNPVEIRTVPDAPESPSQAPGEE